MNMVSAATTRWTAIAPGWWRGLYIAVPLFLFASGCGAQSTLELNEEGADAVVLTLRTPATEIFAEYPPLVAGEVASWLVHVTRRSDFSPHSTGTAALTIGETEGTPVTAYSRGIFRPAVTVPPAGTYSAHLQLLGGDYEERIDLGSVTVYGSLDDVQPAAFGEAGVTFTKEDQWSEQFGVTEATIGSLQRSIPIRGVIAPAPARVADVVAPVSGVLIAERNLQAPAKGARVTQGEELAHILPLFSESSLAAIAARVDEAQTELDRIEQLYEIGAVPASRLQHARRALAVAQSAVPQLGGAVDGEDHHVLRAPLSGFVEERDKVAGATVDVGDRVYRIVDPDVVWVELLLRAPQAQYAQQIESVTFSTEGSSQVFGSDRLVIVASEVDEASRTLSVTFEVQNPAHALSIGLFVSGQAQIAGSETGVLVPNSAVFMEDGQPVGFVQVSGETFARRPLTLGASDGTHTVVSAGIGQGEFYVSQGAHAVYLASLNISGGAGHTH